jgi:hypothetical protein
VVTKGTRKGSVLSPQIFILFINELLCEISQMSDKVSIAAHSYNIFAYADGITVSTEADR